MHGPDPFVRLDSVGGCTTLVRADVHREGALFTPNFAVGGTWEKDGWDAIETEGGLLRWIDINCGTAVGDYARCAPAT